MLIREIGLQWKVRDWELAMTPEGDMGNVMEMIFEATRGKPLGFGE
jgi:hypothetical protein